MKPSGFGVIVFLATNLAAAVTLIWWIRIMDSNAAPSGIAHRYYIVPILACASACILFISGALRWLGSLVDRSQAADARPTDFGWHELDVSSRIMFVAVIFVKTTRFMLVLPALVMLLIAATRVLRLFQSDDPLARQELVRVAPLDCVVAILLAMYVLFARVPGLTFEQGSNEGPKSDA
jgi:hypothetical protein